MFRALPEVRACLPSDWFAEITLNPLERRVLYRDAEPVAFLRPGTHRYWTLDPSVKLVVLDTREPVPALTRELEALIPGSEYVAVTVEAHERGLRFERGRLTAVLEAGRYQLWTHPDAQVRIATVDMRRTEVTIAGQDLMTRDECVEPFALGRGTSSTVSTNEAWAGPLTTLMACLAAAAFGLGGCSEETGELAGGTTGTPGGAPAGAGTTSAHGGSASAGRPSGGAPSAGRGGASATTAGSAGRTSAGYAGTAMGGASGATSSGAGSAGRSGAAGRGGGGGGGASGTGNHAGGDNNGGARDDGGAGSGGAPAEPNGCAGRNLLLCEDFENTSVGSVPSGWTRHGDLAAVDDDDAHAGSRSLKLGPSSNSERRIYHSATALGSAHWGRIYYKVQTPVPDAFVHSTLVSLLGDGPKNGRSDYRPIDTIKQAKDTPDVGGRHNFIYNVQIIGKSEFGTETNYDYVFDAKWHCAEYHIDASNQSYALYLDGQSILGFERGAGSYDKSDIPTSFDEVRVGWINYQSASPGFTAWIDDVAFDDARIGCD